MADWNDVATARRTFADMVAGLDDSQLDHETLSGSWTVRQVTGHLVSFVDVSLFGLFSNMARHRFDYDAAADTLARRTAEAPVDEMLDSLRSKAAKKSPLPMFPPEMTLTDVIVHTQDIRRPLALDGRLDDDAVRTALQFLTSHRMAGQVIDTDALAGLEFEAADVGFVHGEGPKVSGPGEALLLAIAGRPTIGELRGEGVAVLSSRLND